MSTNFKLRPNAPLDCECAVNVLVLRMMLMPILVLSAIHQVQFLILDMYARIHAPVVTPTL